MARDDRRAEPEAVVVELIDRLEQMTVEDTVVLAELWAEADEADRRRAWQRAKAAIDRLGAAGVLDRARQEVGRWMLAGPADYQGISGLLGRHSDEVSLRQLAAPAVLDAVAGLLAEEQLHSADADVLLAPWRAARAPGVTNDDEAVDDDNEG